MDRLEVAEEGMTREEAVARIKDHIAIHRYHERNMVKLSEALDMAIKALEQPEQRWIPCSEKLPEKSGQYYVSGKGKVWICEFLTIHSSTILLGGWCNDAANPVVQAWMPLPEPYREEVKVE